MASVIVSIGSNILLISSNVSVLGIMKTVWGDLFTTREKAEATVFEYFTQCGEEYPPMTLDEFEHHLFAADIGYFTIDYKEINPRSLL